MTTGIVSAEPQEYICYGEDQSDSREGDLIATLLPTAVSMGLKFASSRSSFDVNFTRRSSATSSPSLCSPSWLCVPVPHICRSTAYCSQLPMKDIGGGIVRCAVMLCAYSGSVSTWNSPLGNSAQYAAPSVDVDRDMSFFAPSEATHTNPSLVLGGNRLVVFSTSVFNEGELRLYDLITHHLIAIIRLCNVIKVCLVVVVVLSSCVLITPLYLVLGPSISEPAEHY